MSKFNNITEIIPDDIPEWASNAIADGDFFKVCIKKVELLEFEVSELKKSLILGKGQNVEI